jgi:hypothetical protein
VYVWEAGVAQRVLGRADYKAYRLLGLVHLVATGETANLNDKVDFDQLPFLIFPPMYAFYLIPADIGLPAIMPFKYEENISFPKSARSIRIQDADGVHDVLIADVEIPDFDIAVMAAPTGSNFCVFRGFGINPLMMAPCDARLLPGYERVFGPATHAECEKYIKDNRH